ncbi:MAG: metalloregulator ArsR/SmtB family transcription factor [candidate division WOR-3 bacterium]|jgi:DNA-binding transcriptional ArsR family regulator
MNEVEDLKILFQTLSETNRLKIIHFIRDKKCSVTEIVEETGLSQPLVSHHLKVLREARILEAAREGPFVYYQLKNKRLLEALGIFGEIACCLGGIKTKSRMFCCPNWWEKQSKDS